jgi:hypothetical protein
MNLFFTEVGKIQPIDQFVGGNDKQRAHLNKLVDAVNTIIKTASGCVPWDKLIPLLEGLEIRVSYSEENGQVVTYQILARKIEDIAG